MQTLRSSKVSSNLSSLPMLGVGLTEEADNAPEEFWSPSNIFPTLVLFGTPQERCQFLSWLLYEKGAQITGDLAQFIFGEKQLEEWRTESQRRYPDFELVFSVNRGDDCLELIFYYQPSALAPTVDSFECDFPIEPFEIPLDFFWHTLEGKVMNDIEFTWYCYPDQNSLCADE